MYQVQQTNNFVTWLSKLKDRSAIAKLLIRIESLRQGNLAIQNQSDLASMNSDYTTEQVIESITLGSLVWWFSYYAEEISRAKARTSLVLEEF